MKDVAAERHTERSFANCNACKLDCAPPPQLLYAPQEGFKGDDSSKGCSPISLHPLQNSHRNMMKEHSSSPRALHSLAEQPQEHDEGAQQQPKAVGLADAGDHGA